MFSFRVYVFGARELNFPLECATLLWKLHIFVVKSMFSKFSSNIPFSLKHMLLNGVCLVLDDNILLTQFLFFFVRCFLRACFMFCRAKKKMPRLGSFAAFREFCRAFHSFAALREFWDSPFKFAPALVLYSVIRCFAVTCQILVVLSTVYFMFVFFGLHLVFFFYSGCNLKTHAARCFSMLVFVFLSGLFATHEECFAVALRVCMLALEHVDRAFVFAI